MTTPLTDKSTKLRSRDWFGKDDRWGMAHRAWLRAEGFSVWVFEGKPVLGICNHNLQAHAGCDFDFLRGRDSGDDDTPLREFPNPAL